MKRDSFKQQVDELFSKFDDEYTKSRAMVAEKLYPLYIKLKGDIQDIYEIQPEMLSTRQIISDQMSFFIGKLLKVNKKIREVESSKLQDYLPMKKDGYSSKDIQMMIDDDLKEIKAQKEILEIHIDFLKECRRNCDQIGYGIKNRNAIAVYL
jgi:hypothetical protein